MYDLQLVVPVNTVALTQVAQVPGTSPAVLDIQGEDFRSVSEVKINSISSPNFAVLSTTRLRALMPTGVTMANLQNVEVVSADLTLTEQSLLSFELPNVPRAVSGVLRMAQLYLKILFTTPGTDIFNQELGGGALKNLGRTYNTAVANNILGDMQISVARTTRQVLAIQARQPRLPASERLLSAEIISKSMDNSSGTILLGLELLNHLRQPAKLNFNA